VLAPQQPQRKSVPAAKLAVRHSRWGLHHPSCQHFSCQGPFVHSLPDRRPLTHAAIMAGPRTHAAASSKKHTVASRLPHMHLLILGRAHAAAACIVLSLDFMRHVCPGWWLRGRPFPVRAHNVVSTLADPTWLVQVVDLNVAGAEVPLLWRMYGCRQALQISPAVFATCQGCIRP
jgi:hypothetical protein